MLAPASIRKLIEAHDSRTMHGAYLTTHLIGAVLFTILAVLSLVAVAHHGGKLLGRH